MNLELAGAPADVQFFGWALDGLPEARALSGLLAVPNALPPEVATSRVREVYRRYLFGIAFAPSEPSGVRYRELGISVPAGLPRYVDIVGANFGLISVAPDELYDADHNQPGVIDDLAYQATLAGFLGGFAGDSYAMNWLAVLLLRGPLNRQLAIGRFLGMLTHGQVGTVEPTLPTKDEVVQWAQTLVRENVVVGDERLWQIIRSYAEFASPSRGFF